MVLVLGSTGTNGGEVARQLIRAGVKPRLLVPDPLKASAFDVKEDIVQGDLTNPYSLDVAMKHIENVCLVSEAASGIQFEVNAVDAARRAGVKHVAKLSVVGIENS